MKLKPIRRSVGLMLLADGIRELYETPQKYVRGLQRGTPLSNDKRDYFQADNPRLTLIFSITEMTIGLWLTLG